MIEFGKRKMDYNEYVTGSGFNLSDLKANPSIGYFISFGKKAKSQFAEPDAFDRIVNLVSKNWFSPFDDQIFKTLNNKVFAAIGGYIFLKLLYDRLYTIQNFQKSSKGVGHLRRNIRKTILLLKRTGLWAFLPKNGIYNEAIPDKKKIIVPTNTLVEKLGLKRSTPDAGVTMKVQVTANKRPRIEVATNTQTTFSTVNTNQPVLNNTTTTLDYFGRPVWFKPNIQPLMSTTGQEMQDLILINQSPVKQKMEKLKNDLMSAIVSIRGVQVSNIIAQSLVTDITKAMEPLLEALEKRLAEKNYIMKVGKHVLDTAIKNTLAAMGAKSEQVKQYQDEILQAVKGVIAKFILETAQVNIPVTKHVSKKPMGEGNNPKIPLGDSDSRQNDAILVTGQLRSIHPPSLQMELVMNEQNTDKTVPLDASPVTAAADTVGEEQEEDVPIVKDEPQKTESSDPSVYFNSHNKHKKDNSTYKYEFEGEEPGKQWVIIKDTKDQPLARFPIMGRTNAAWLTLDTERLQPPETTTTTTTTGKGVFTGGAEFTESYNIGEYLGYLGKMAQKVDTFYSMCDPAKQQIFRDLAEKNPVMLGAVLEQKKSPTTALTITTLPTIGTTRLTVKTPATGFDVTPMS